MRAGPLAVAALLVMVALALPASAAGKPDLKAASITITPSSPKQGDEVGMRLSFSNVGQSSTGPYKIQVRIDGAVRGAFDHNSLSGSSAPQSFTFKLKWGTGTGGKDHTVEFALDSGGAVDESNEANNVVSKTYFVAAASTTTKASTTSTTTKPTTTTTATTSKPTTYTSTSSFTPPALEVKSATATALDTDGDGLDDTLRVRFTVHSGATQEGNIGFIVKRGSSSTAWLGGDVRTWSGDHSGEFSYTVPAGKESGRYFGRVTLVRGSGGGTIESQMETSKVELSPVASSSSTPGAPSSPLSWVDGSHVVLDWSAPSSAGSTPVSHYALHRKEGTGAYAKIRDDDAAAFAHGPSFRFTDTAVTPGVTYTYKVQARNAAGEGAFSLETSARVGPGEEQQPKPPTEAEAAPPDAKAQPDGDADGVPDGSDNCPGTPNPAQANFDADALGDPCDADADNDGVIDPAFGGRDKCPLTANPDQRDIDGNGVGDWCQHPPPEEPRPRNAAATVIAPLLSDEMPAPSVTLERAAVSDTHAFAAFKWHVPTYEGTFGKALADAGLQSFRYMPMDAKVRPGPGVRMTGALLQGPIHAGEAAQGAGGTLGRAVGEEALENACNALGGEGADLFCAIGSPLAAEAASQALDGARDGTLVIQGAAGEGGDDWVVLVSLEKDDAAAPWQVELLTSHRYELKPTYTMGQKQMGLSEPPAVIQRGETARTFVLTDTPSGGGFPSLPRQAAADLPGGVRLLVEPLATSAQDAFVRLRWTVPDRATVEPFLDEPFRRPGPVRFQVSRAELSLPPGSSIVMAMPSSAEGQALLSYMEAAAFGAAGFAAGVACLPAGPVVAFVCGKVVGTGGHVAYDWWSAEQDRRATSEVESGLLFTHTRESRFIAEGGEVSMVLWIQKSGAGDGLQALDASVEVQVFETVLLRGVHVPHGGPVAVLQGHAAFQVAGDGAETVQDITPAAAATPVPSPRVHNPQSTTDASGLVALVFEVENPGPTRSIEVTVTDPASGQVVGTTQVLVDAGATTQVRLDGVALAGAPSELAFAERGQEMEVVDAAASGVSLAPWAMALAVLVLAGTGAGATVRRWRSRTKPDPVPHHPVLLPHGGWEAAPGPPAPPPPPASPAMEWSSRTVPELKAELRARGLKVSGRKADLVARLAGAGAEAPPEARAPRGPTVRQLQAQLRALGLSTRGKKAALAARLASAAAWMGQEQASAGLGSPGLGAAEGSFGALGTDP